MVNPIIVVEIGGEAKCDYAPFVGFVRVVMREGGDHSVE